jgi:hypothetical protein
MPMAQPRARRAKDADSSRMTAMSAKNIAPNWFGHQIKRRCAEPTSTWRPQVFSGEAVAKTRTKPKATSSADELYGKAKATS